jgi:methylated-DNA-[protein]-cysteine S-methyltransferase
MTTMYYDYLTTPIGRLLLAGDERGLARLEFDNPRQGCSITADWKREAAPLRAALEQVRAYFAGELLDFQLTLRPQGTEFQRAVWNQLARIPYGETWTYGQIAKLLDRPDASRAVGAANGANPIPVILPCHRVIGSNGSLTGFGGGLPTKRWLLDHERRFAPVPGFVLEA